MLHVYDWLSLPAKDEGERAAKEWLRKFSQPAYDKGKNGSNDWLASYPLTCEYKDERYWCRGCSRLGDVWITKDSTGKTYYDHRVNVEECSNWIMFEGKGFNKNSTMEPLSMDEIKAELSPQMKSLWDAAAKCLDSSTEENVSAFRKLCFPGEIMLLQRAYAMSVIKGCCRGGSDDFETINLDQEQAE